ncbi:hypothetical protein [Acidithiobacillus acidisediminis]|uniref:hypothetical protein n=1 Tax=Acidithiobacillus acidisediminis TaxID=2937799 RepID=UPI00200F41CB|nr:hypothetical protein [Acidithiobacillus sp. S30A2]
MKKNLVLTSVVVIAAASLSGCNFGESNHLLGNWKLESISVSSNAPAEYAKVAALLSAQSKGERLTFTPEKIVYHMHGNVMSLKVLKYEIKDGGHKVVVVQKQHKLGADVVEYQPAMFHDDYHKVDLTSGLLVMHLKREHD